MYIKEYIFLSALCVLLYSIYSVCYAVPEKLLPEELASIIAGYSPCFNWLEDHVIFRFYYKNNCVKYIVQLSEQLVKTLLPEQIACFNYNQEADKYPWVFSWSNFKEEPAMRLWQKQSYFISELKQAQAAQPTEINLEELSEFIKNHKVLFYTGAGISVKSNIPLMAEVEEKLCIKAIKGPEPDITELLKAICFQPEVIAQVIYDFCNSLINAQPTQAHYALKQLAEYKQTHIITDNLDLLHQRTGIKSIFAFAQELKKTITEQFLSAIDTLICIGISHDDKGVISWYKKCNQTGKLISLNLVQPNYLDDSDLFIKGDVQVILPQLLKNVTSLACAR